MGNRCLSFSFSDMARALDHYQALDEKAWGRPLRTEQEAMIVYVIPKQMHALRGLLMAQNISTSEDLRRAYTSNRLWVCNMAREFSETLMGDISKAPHHVMVPFGLWRGLVDWSVSQNGERGNFFKSGLERFYLPRHSDSFSEIESRYSQVFSMGGMPSAPH